MFVFVFFFRFASKEAEIRVRVGECDERKKNIKDALDGKAVRVSCSSSPGVDWLDWCKECCDGLYYD